jgi:chromosome segregation ATPase
LRSALKNSMASGAGVNRNLMDTFTKNDRLEQLQRQLMEQQTENERLRHEASVTVQNYLRQLESKEDVIRNLKMRMEDGQVEAGTRRETALRQENNMLRDKLSTLQRELEDSQAPRGIDALESEIKRLRGDLVDKEREHSRQID